MKNSGFTRRGYTARLLFSISLFLLTGPLYTQINLVPNGGFDDLLFCPSDHSQLSVAPPWETMQGTPDIYHECASNILYRTPYPQICMYLPPENGKGYTGITVYGTREFLETDLTAPLQAGRPYYIRFYVAPDEDCAWNQPPAFSDAISLQLRRDLPDENFMVVAENSGQVLNDTANWTKISRCYYAKGKERRLRIGNPKPDAQTIYETAEPDYPFPENYVFVDDIFIGTFDPFPDTLLLCEGTPLALDATFLESEYHWDTGETSAVKTVTNTGTFMVEATLEGCVFRDTVVVISPPGADNLPLGNSLICSDESSVLTAPIPGSYRWSNGSDGRQTTIDAAGTYTVSVTNACGEFVFSQTILQEACRCKVFVPNIFTPDGDNRSDVLDISFGCAFDYQFVVFEIFDRWGSRVFSTPDIFGPGWNGNINGRPAPPGVYVWRLRYTLTRSGSRQSITEQGDIALIRRSE